MIDDDNVYWALSWFQFEAKLLLDGREERRAGGIRQARVDLR